MGYGHPRTARATLLVLLIASVLLAGCPAVLDVLGLGPTADFTYSPTTVFVGDTVTLNASSSTGDSISYAWQFISFPSGFSPNFSASAGVTTTFDPTVAGTYVVQLTVTNSSGSNSKQVSIVVLAVGLNPPSDLAVSATTSSSITLTWSLAYDDSGNQAIGYQVWRSTTQNGTFTKITQTNLSSSTTTYTNLNLQPGQTFWYALKAVYQGNNLSSPSPAVQGSAQSASYAVPTGLTVGSPTSYSLSVSWTGMSGATSYKVYRSTTSNDPSAATAFSGGATSFVDQPLASGTTYYYSVQALYSGGGQSAKSTEVPGTTSATISIPAPPTGLVISSPTATSLTISWSSSAGATSYNLYRNGGFLVNVGGTSHTDTGLTSSTYYSYSVNASNSAGTSANSSNVVGQTLATGVTVVAPSAPTISSVSVSGANPTSALVITWSPPSGADGTTQYRLFRDFNQLGTFTTQVVQTSATSFTDSNLGSSTTYYYKLQAGNSGLDQNSNPITLWSGLSSAVAGTTQAPVVVNNPPYPASYSSPTSGQAGVDPATLGYLSWDYPGDPEGDALTFNLYFGVVGQGMSLILNHAVDTSWYVPAGFLAYSTSYQWYVVVNDPTHSTVSPTWYFSTSAAPTTPPNVSITIDTPQATYVTGNAVALSGSVTSSINGAPLAGTWSLSGPSGSFSTLSSATGTSTSFTPDVEGYYYIYLTGSENGVYSSNYTYIYAALPTQGVGTINLK